MGLGIGPHEQHEVSMGGDQRRVTHYGTKFGQFIKSLDSKPLHNHCSDNQWNSHALLLQSSSLAGGQGGEDSASTT